MEYDIIIVGGGIVGQTFACALAQQTALSIAILEIGSNRHAWSASPYHHRVSAVSLSSQRIFAALGVWDNIRQKRVSAFQRIHVWDAIGKGEICFDSREIAEPVLGYILENNVIQSALAESIKQYPQIDVLPSTQLAFFSENKDDIEMISTDECRYKAKLVIAADGAHSWLRTQAGMPMDKKNNEQEAIVAMVHTALPHQQIARQGFLETGPLAFLPLAHSNMSSIVWSLAKEKAEPLMQLPSHQFQVELAKASSHCLGDILDVDKRYRFPLMQQHTKKYVKSRVVLMGDAAHVIYPLAGQGVNMGLLDAACLAEVIAQADKDGRDMAFSSYLRRYERWRMADNLAMLKAVNMMHALFMSEKRPIQWLRSFGLDLTNQTRWIKNIFTRYAVGNREGLPMLALKEGVQ